MSDEEVERFEVTDYDLDNEFNINRPSRRFTKNQRIYGVWAEDSDDEEETTSRRPAGGRRGANYTAPVSFVSGGLQLTEKQKAEKLRAAKAAEGEEDDDEDDHAGSSRVRDSSSEEDVPAPRRRTFAPPQGETAGLRRAGSSRSAAAGGVGEWERHTKGIGAKLLLQMGFQPGKGLGKELQGIAAPVEARLRRGRGAIGAYGPEVKQRLAETPATAAAAREKAAATAEGDDKEAVEALSLWRRDAALKGKATRYVYKTVDQLLQQGGSRPRAQGSVALSRVKVIDLTGPQRRELSGYHAIGAPRSEHMEARADRTTAHFSLPELQHNLRLIVDMCEQDILENERATRAAKERLAALAAEEAALSTALERRESHEQALAALVDALEKLPLIDLEDSADLLQKLQEDHFEEWRLYEAPAAAAALLGPRLRERLQTWDALARPDDHVALFARWRLLLSGGNGSGEVGGGDDAYQRLLWEAWMPSVRQAVTKWRVRDAATMWALVEAWIPLLPPWLVEHLRERLLLPRIQREADDWDPVTDTEPIHVWVQPWLPLLRSRLETAVFPVIRQKLSRALGGWHPSDRSARLVLLPWVGVFPRGDMDAFLVKHIVPKLTAAMHELVINPHQQHLDQWNWVMEWKELVAPPVLSTVLEKAFFPKWMQVLTLWLNHAPDYDEVTNWYCGWKTMLPDCLRSQPVVSEYFRKALDMMNRAVGAPAGESPAAEPETSDLQRTQLIAQAARGVAHAPADFRTLVARRCEERGLVFAPMPRRTREGRQVYRCGRAQVYIDRSVLFLSLDGVAWAPCSLNAALDVAAG